jgi:uncharacterized membrane protein YdbT with pleckstrin-like domain
MPDTEKHRQEASSRLSSIGKKFFELIEFDPKEELVCEVRKHPFGLFLIELAGFVISAIVGGIPVLIALNFGSTNFLGDVTNAKLGFVLVGGLFALFGIGATFIAGVIYKNNVIYVTSEKIAQVLYTSLFSRKISQLSIGDVQDVTVKQIGIFPRLIGYGTLVVETAGEQQNYTFTFVPDPYITARKIVEAHEENLKLFGN